MTFMHFFCVFAACSLGVCFIIRGFTPVQIYPDWLIELHFTFFWALATLRTLSQSYIVMAEKRYWMAEWKGLVGSLFMLHLAAILILRFAPIPPAIYTLPLLVYPVAFFALAWIPLQLFYAFYPAWMKIEESEKLSPRRVFRLASRLPQIKAIVERWPPLRVFVYNHARKNGQAKCIIQIRRPRQELDGLMQDILIQVMVDMKRKKPIEESCHIQRYIFRDEGGKSALYPLPDVPSVELVNPDQPLDEWTLERFEACFTRFPSLRDCPLPIATGGKHYASFDLPA